MDRRLANRTAADWGRVFTEVLLWAFTAGLISALVVLAGSRLMANKPWLVIAPAAASLLVAALAYAAAAAGYRRQRMYAAPVLLLAAGMLDWQRACWMPVAPPCCTSTCCMASLSRPSIASC